MKALSKLQVFKAINKLQSPRIHFKQNQSQEHVKKLLSQYLQFIIISMKKFKLQSVNLKPVQLKPFDKLQAAKSKVGEKTMDKAQQQKLKKRQQLQKQMKMLQDKISQKDNNIKQTEKMLNIDEFLKKQKEKTREYALKLNQQYEKQKKQREIKLYKKYNRAQIGSEKLMTITTKNQIPLNIFSAVDQLKKSQNTRILDDHHYRLNDMLLDVSKNELFEESLTKQQQKYLKSKKQNSWKKIKQVSANSAQTKYLPVQQQNGQLQPSDFGEPLISALTLMPKDLSEYLYYQHQSINKNLYFLFKFYPGGERKSVITNQFIEVRQYTHKYVNVNSRHKNGLTFWSTLLQKAYKKLYFGQISSTNLYEAIQTVYGLDAQIIPFNNLATIKQNFTHILNALLSCSPKACIGFINDRADTYDRIYPLTSIQFPMTQKKKKKKHGQQEVKQEILYNLSNPYTGILKQDYINKFTINQLWEKFNRLIVLRQYPEKWSGIRIKIQFLSNGPITFTSTDWVKNNQYSFTLLKSVQTRLALRRSWGVLPQSQKKQQQKLLFGFILFKSSEGETQISTMKLQNLIAKVKSNDENGCILNRSLQKGTYIVIPYSHLVSQQHMQAFNFDVILQRQDLITVNKAKIYEYYYQNKPSNDQKVVQKLQSRVKYQKPKSQKIALPKLSFHPSNKQLTQKYLQSLGIVLKNDVKISDLLIPGKLRPFLIEGQIKQTKKQKKQKKSQQVLEIQKYQKEEALKILLGYDALLDKDINHGQMMAILNETSDQIDLADFYLGQQGVMAIMESLMALPRIKKLDLSNNDLNDSVVIYLCYYLQKGCRNELRQLNLSGNRIGKTGLKALRGLKQIFNQVQIVGVKV